MAHAWPRSPSSRCPLRCRHDGSVRALSFVLLLTTPSADRCRRGRPFRACPHTKDFPLTADMSVAPEIARLAEAALIVTAQSAASPHDTQAQENPEKPLTLGALSRQLRMIAATPERWWSLVRFDGDRSVKVRLEAHPSFEAWLVVMPPGDVGQDCDCDVVTIIAGEATDGTASNAVLRPGPLRVHGPQHQLRGQ